MSGVSPGFREDERDRVATLYWAAFSGKLGRLLRPDDKALAFIAAVADPTHALTYRDASGEIRGMAGFKTYDGAFVGGTFKDLAAAYGPLGALWRAGLLALLERDVDNDRFLMDGLCVAAEARGQGIGTALIAGIVAEAAARGYPAVRLDVIDSNPRARALYLREGFAPAGDQSLGLLAPIFGFRAATTMVRPV